MQSRLESEIIDALMRLGDGEEKVAMVSLDAVVEDEYVNFGVSRIEVQRSGRIPRDIIVLMAKNDPVGMIINAGTD